MDNGSFSIISLTECQEALSEGQFVKQTRDTLSGADVCAQSVGIDSCTNWGLFLGQWNLTKLSSAQMKGVYGDSYVH